MVFEQPDNLVCPLDGLALKQLDRQWACANGHSFDTAKQGYINLLPVQFKRSRQPGDSKEMMTARSCFLNSGAFQSIAERLHDTVNPLLGAKPHACVVDAGCGDGYYLQFLYDRLSGGAGSSTLSMLGLDISKWAIIHACKRGKPQRSVIRWLVASNKHMPVASSSVDILLCMFGFPHYAEFRRVLRPDGILLLVQAGAEHLLELREIIYPEVRLATDAQLEEVKNTGFALKGEQVLRESIKLDNRQLKELMLMTPHLYRASQAGKQAIEALATLQVRLQVRFRLFGRVSN